MTAEEREEVRRFLHDPNGEVPRCLRDDGREIPNPVEEKIRALEDEAKRRGLTRPG